MNFTIHIADTEITLSAEGAAYLLESKSLVVADVHLGKSATFRSRGVPIPEGSTLEDLERMTALIEEFQAERLIIAGDFVHASDGFTDYVSQSLEQWLQELNVEVVLTKGNHDAHTVVALLQRLGITVCGQMETDGFTITHYPEDLPADSPGIAGHLHPGIKLSETHKTKLALQGYYLKDGKHLVLPSFSRFTGNHFIIPEAKDRFIAIASGRLYEIPR